MSQASQQIRATIDDLYRVDGKAELIDGRIVHLMATGHLPNIVAGRIYRRLADFVDGLGRGVAYTDNMGFAVAELSSGRESFSPDVSFYDGPLPNNRMRFIAGPPTFAVEVRSEGDYGPAADREYDAKRLDYFEAGTRRRLGRRPDRRVGPFLPPRPGRGADDLRPRPSCRRRAGRARLARGR